MLHVVVGQETSEIIEDKTSDFSESVGFESTRGLSIRMEGTCRFSTKTWKMIEGDSLTFG